MIRQKFFMPTKVMWLFDASRQIKKETRQLIKQICVVSFICFCRFHNLSNVNKHFDLQNKLLLSFCPFKAVFSCGSFLFLTFQNHLSLFVKKQKPPDSSSPPFYKSMYTRLHRFINSPPFHPLFSLQYNLTWAFCASIQTAEKINIRLC